MWAVMVIIGYVAHVAARYYQIKAAYEKRKQ